MQHGFDCAPGRELSLAAIAMPRCSGVDNAVFSVQAGVNGLVCGALVIEAVAGLLMVGGAQRVREGIPPHMVDADGVCVTVPGDQKIGGLQRLRRRHLFRRHGLQKPCGTAVTESVGETEVAPPLGQFLLDESRENADGFGGIAAHAAGIQLRSRQ